MVIAFISGIPALLWQKRDDILSPLLESAANRSLNKSFTGTLRISGFHLDSSGQVNISKITASWKVPSGPFPFSIENIRLETPLISILSKPAVFSFQHLRPAGSPGEGISGKITSEAILKGQFNLEADVLDLELQDMARLNPENLNGSSGKIVGKIIFRTVRKNEQPFVITLSISEPGGKIQARFFDILIPYLPGANQKAVRSQIPSGGTVDYRHAALKIELANPEKVKILFNILVPAYNLNLNLNAEVHVEEESAFLQIAQLMDLAKGAKN